MLGAKRVLKQFDTYHVTYAITNPLGRDYARIDLFNKKRKVGQILFGSAIQPGSYASVHGNEIDLYFPLSHFDSILMLLRSGEALSLFASGDADSVASMGGLTNSPS